MITKLYKPKDLTRVGTTILLMAAAIGIMGLTIALLGMCEPEKLAIGSTIVAGLAGLLAFMVHSLKGAGDAMKSIIAMAAAIAVMAIAVGVLSFVDADKLFASTTAMVSVMGMFALIMQASKNVNASIGTLVVMTVAIALMAACIYVLAKLPVENVLGSALALSLVMAACAAALYVAGKVGKFAKDALIGVLALTAMVVPLAGFVGVLALMQGVSNAEKNAKVLLGMMTVCALLLPIVCACGLLGWVGLIGVLALALFAVAMAHFVGVLYLMQFIEDAEKNAELLTNMMKTMVGLLVILAIIGPFAIIGVTALTMLITLMGIVVIFAMTLGQLCTMFPALQTFLDVGLPIMIQLATAMGQMIGGFIAAVSTAVMAVLPQLGLCLSQFMVAITPFIIGVKMVDTSVLAGVTWLSLALLEFGAASFIAALLSLGGLTLAPLGASLSAFMINAMPFIAGAMTIKPSMVDGVRALAETILILTAANVLDGIVSFFTGSSSLENFAAQLPILGQGLAGFTSNIGVFSPEQVTTVACAAMAIKMLAQASSDIPNAGGLLGKLVGENDLGLFAAQFPILGTGLRQFLDNVGVFTPEEVATVNCAAESIKLLATAASEIPNQGGWVGAIVGENTLQTFAEQFPHLGTGLSEFITNVGTFGQAELDTVNYASEAIKALATASADIPNQGGWVGAIVGENTLQTFAEQFPHLGTGLRTFLTNIIGEGGVFGEDELNIVKFACDAIVALSTAASEIPNQGGWIGAIIGDNNLGDFASQFPSLGEGLRGFIDKVGVFTSDEKTTMVQCINAVRAFTDLAGISWDKITDNVGELCDVLPDFADSMSSFCEDLPDAETVQTAITNLKTLLEAISALGDTDTGPFVSFTENMKTVGQDSVTKFVEAFTSEATKTDLVAAGEALGDSVISGVEAKEDPIKSAGESAAKEAVEGFKTQNGEDGPAESAGKNLGQGYINGIGSKKTGVYNAGYALGKKAAQGINDGQASASPSKLAIKSGKWLGEGYIIGMGRMGDKVSSAGENLGSTATNALSTSISRMSAMIGSDIDTQPTIRPVMDLSDIRSGVGVMNRMLNANSSVGVSANVGAISTMMSNRGQNGSNAEVVAAINKLRSDLGNIGSNTYNINGVTYDDGSNISNAVATIVRAARIERRV